MATRRRTRRTNREGSEGESDSGSDDQTVPCAPDQTSGGSGGGRRGREDRRRGSQAKSSSVSGCCSCCTWKVALCSLALLGLLICIGNSPPNMSVLCFTVGVYCPNAHVEGFVAPDYTEIREVFKEGFLSGYEVGSQVVAYVDGELVVDLAGGYLHHGLGANEPYTADLLQLVFSSTKIAESLVIGMLVDRGHLDYAARIADYWPEFAAKGKENITLSQLMTHQAGLAAPPSPLTFDILNDEKALSEWLENQEPNWPVPPYPPTSDVVGRQAYHACTRGLYSSQIVRRVDPKGRTLAEFFTEEVTDKLGIEFYIGLPTEARKRLAPLHGVPTANVLFNTLLRLFLPSYIDGWLFSDDPFFDLSSDEEKWIWDILLTNGLPARSMNNPIIPYTLMSQLIHTEEFQSAELPSQNGVTNARGLARIANVFAFDGVDPITGTRLLSSETVALMQRKIPPQYDEVLLEKTGYTYGGLGATSFDIGWGGMGGSLVRWSPDERVVFAYVPSQMGLRVSARDPRACTLRQAVWDVAMLKLDPTYVAPDEPTCLDELD